ISYKELISLPKPKGKIVAAVYDFRDQTGQYLPSPASNFSTAVTQGGVAMLSTALWDSQWFVPLEREGLQNLLTERKIVRAAQNKPNAPGNNANQLPSLVAANILIEGGIVAYDSNVRTGGAGAKYFGIGASGEYRVDQVTVNLRAVDIRTGRILNSVTTSKTVLSQQIQAGVFRFVEYKRLLEAEAGFSTNEPVQMCVMSAIESGVIRLIANGVRDNLWQLSDPRDINNPVLQQYLNENTPIL
ncbi:MAG: CsgG/HfaB family protein, partial [Aeromonas sp.]